MNVSLEQPADLHPGRGDGTSPRPGRRNRAGARRRRPWFGLFAFVVLSWLALFAVGPYVTLDPATARIDLREDVSLHYPVLVVHVATGTVAMVTGLLQIWPRLRRSRPRVHRVSGRIYASAVFLGAPALVALIVLRAPEPGNAPSTTVFGFSVQTVLWVLTTVAGFRMARRRRFAEHRRWMVYSFALTLSIMWSRVAYLAAMAIPGFQTQWVVDNIGWVPWVLNLLVAQWWLNRTARRPLALPATYRDAG